MTEILVRKVIGGINGLKAGTKSKLEVEALLARLEDANPGMYDEYYKKYQRTLAELEKGK